MTPPEGTIGADIDFTEIRSSDQGVHFEQFIEALLDALGWTIVSGVGKGPDGGRDIIAETGECTATGRLQTRRFVVQCRHHAHSGKSVGPGDISDCAYMPDKHNCDGWLLVTSTQLTNDAVKHIEAAREMRPGKDFDHWDSGRLRTRLMRDGCHSVFRQYLPISYARFANILVPSPAEIRSLVERWLEDQSDRKAMFSLAGDSDGSLTGFFAKYGQKLQDLRGLLADESLCEDFMSLWQSSLARGKEKASGVVLLNGLCRLHQLREKGLPVQGRHDLLCREIAMMVEFRELQRRYWREFIVFEGVASYWRTVRGTNFPPIFLQVMYSFFCPERGQAASGLVRFGANEPEAFVVSYSIESGLAVKAPYEFELMMDRGSDPIIVVATAFSEFEDSWVQLL